MSLFEIDVTDMSMYKEHLAEDIDHVEYTVEL